ncbi:MAG: hypothetical protein ACRDYW_10205 [Acidimicrobiales bacterium]
MTPAARALRPPGPTSRARRVTGRLGRCIAVGLATGVLIGCGTGSGGAVDEVGEERDGPNPGVVPTMPGGVELVVLDPATVLVGADVAFGAPLPSEQAAADAFTADPEVDAAVARRARSTADGRRLADVVVLALDGSELFDDSVLAAFERGAVGALGGGAATDGMLAGRGVLRAGGADGRVAVGFREGNLLAIVSGASAPDVDLVVTRQLEALGRGEVGSGTPVTPLVGVPPDSAFVEVPTVAFAPFPDPEDQEPPPTPDLAGAARVAGRYGVVAGERRTVVWSFAVAGAYPSAEAVEPAMQAAVSQLASGAAVRSIELIDRLVHSASVSEDEVTRAASVFVHQGLVLVVEGADAAQVDAVVTAWITALGPS